MRRARMRRRLSKTNSRVHGFYEGTGSRPSRIQPRANIASHITLARRVLMANQASRNDFVEMVAQEVSSGIGRALDFWLGRIELELIDRSLTATQRIDAIEGILQEYKVLGASVESARASV